MINKIKIILTWTRSVRCSWYCTRRCRPIFWRKILVQITSTRWRPFNRTMGRWYILIMAVYKIILLHWIARRCFWAQLGHLALSAWHATALLLLLVGVIMVLMASLLLISLTSTWAGPVQRHLFHVFFFLVVGVQWLVCYHCWLSNLINIKSGF